MTWQTSSSKTKSSTQPANGQRPSAHATSKDASSWNSRRVAISALFCAAALVASFIEIPIFPLAPYLKYDPSGVVCLVAGLLFGPAIGACTAVLPWVIRLLTDPFGAIMAMACSLAATLPAAFIYRRHHSFKGAVAGLLIAAVVTLAVALLGNLVITPLYSGMPLETVATLIVPVLLPFNLLKIAINTALTLAVYKPVSTMVGQ